MSRNFCRSIPLYPLTYMPQDMIRILLLMMIVLVLSRAVHTSMAKSTTNIYQKELKMGHDNLFGSSSTCRRRLLLLLRCNHLPLGCHLQNDQKQKMIKKNTSRVGTRNMAFISNPNPPWRSPNLLSIDLKYHPSVLIPTIVSIRPRRDLVSSSIQDPRRLFSVVPDRPTSSTSRSTRTRKKQQIESTSSSPVTTTSTTDVPRRRKKATPTSIPSHVDIQEEKESIPKLDDDHHHQTNNALITESQVPTTSPSSSPPPPTIIPATISSTAQSSSSATILSTTNHQVEEKQEQQEEKEIVVIDSIKNTSKPIPGGNWNPNNPLHWCCSFGQRSPDYDRLVRQKVQVISPDQEGYYPLHDFIGPKHVTMITTRNQAHQVLQTLCSEQAQHTYHACDTEVMDIDLNHVGPVGHGYVTCLSIYSGPTFDYGLGQGPGSTLWIDNLDASYGLLEVFKDWLQDERYKKVWHNYGFDRHVLWNEGIDVKGFGGDTMHMARLQDTSRMQNGGYSLESLTGELLGRRKTPMKEMFGIARIRKDGSAGSLLDIPPVQELQRNPLFRGKWIEYSAYDAEGTWKLREKLQHLLQGMRWIRDMNLFDYYCEHMRKFGEVLTDMERRGIRVDAKDYLASVEKQAREDREYHLAEFRKWAFQMIGPDGLALNPASSTQLCTFLFGGSENIKTKQDTPKARVFSVSRDELSEEALEMYRSLEEEKKNDPAAQLVGGTDHSSSIQSNDELDQMKVEQLKALCKEMKLKVSGKKAELIERLRAHIQQSSQQNSSLVEVKDDYDSMTDDELSIACEQIGGQRSCREVMLKHLREDNAYILQLRTSMSQKSLDGYKTISDILASSSGLMSTILTDLKEKKSKESKNIDVTITSIGMKPEKFTESGAPSVTADVLKSLAGDPFRDPPKYGSAYTFFGGGEKGHEASVALYSLTAIGSIDTMIATFLTSLQEVVDHESRVHCSLNLNTETGRLSSRKPNLQNQPALEKDKYKIRKAFQASPGNNLIVADYGQLELRLLASMTNCRSMIDAFAAGGDFHSRTAMGMFEYIKKQVDEGECLLEWDYSKGEPPKPLLKDKYASERRKAKTLNFSIAYGKTAHGLSQDWGVSIEEANEMLNAWYRSRPEVLEWQEKTKALARRLGLTRTLMGRFRQLPAAQSRDRKLKSQGERASINTPIQGGAADIAMMAMIKINESEILKRLGWVLLMQIHDEVILEGPEETAEEAFKEVVKCMEAPWALGLPPTSVPLLVDGSWKHKNWYEAK